MLIVEVVVVLAILFGIAVVATGRGGGLRDAPPDTVPPGVPPDGPLRSTDVPQLRFRVGLRGYRMSEVDEALDRLQASLAALERPAAETAEPPPPAAPAATGPWPLPPLAPSAASPAEPASPAWTEPTPAPDATSEPQPETGENALSRLRDRFRLE